MRLAWLLVVLTLAACDTPAPAPVLVLGGQTVTGTRNAATLVVDADGQSHLTLGISTGADVDASDAVAFYEVHLDLAPGVRGGDLLVVDGDATLDDAGALTAFAPRFDHDARVSAAWMTIRAFIGSGTAPFVQRVQGTVNVREIDAAHAAVSVELTSEGDIWHYGGIRQSVRVSGPFTAVR